MAEQSRPVVAIGPGPAKSPVRARSRRPVRSPWAMPDPTTRPSAGADDPLGVLLRQHALRSLSAAAAACADVLVLGLPEQARPSAHRIYRRELAAQFDQAYQSARSRLQRSE
jgi:hypothetical protein